MPCRVGITTDPQTRKSYWQSQVVGMYNWKIIGKHNSKEDAQEHETNYAVKHNCLAFPGGASAAGTWYVYRFDYLRIKPQ